jgi:hypothetical protein
VSSLSHRSALLIGIEHYVDDHFARLASIRADLEQLGEVLNNRAIGGFDVQVKSDLRAGEMRQAINEFCLAPRDPGELALLYISSHGVRTPAGEFFFVASDTDGEDLDGSAVSATFVNECLENCFSQQRVAVLDCCRSGGFAIGFRTKGSKSAGGEDADRASHLSPLAPTGVYVLSSSDVDQASFAGGGSLDDPEPSLFTGALVDVLRSGRAGTSASGLVSVDDLFDAVTDELRHAPRRQTPVKSAIRVSGRIPIAARPLGGSPRLATKKQRDAREPRTGPGRVPGWPELLAYYRDAVRAEMGSLPLLPVRGDGYVCLPGRERVLCGATDEDGCVPLPSDAEQFISSEASNDGVEWWVGWPAVVLFVLQSRFSTK